MAEWQGASGAVGTSVERVVRAVTGRQPYRLDVPGTQSAQALSVVSFEAIERLGEPYRITIELTHPDELVRADYLGKDATFSIDSDDGREPRKFSGCITGFSKLKATADFTAYQIVVEAHVARLRIVRNTRIFQHKTGPEIIEAILRRHGFKGHQFRFKLRRETYRTHAFRFQYNCSDWDYIKILMQREGLFCYWTQGEFGDEIVWADDIDFYLYTPDRTVPHRETAGLESSGVEAISSLQTHAQVVAQSVRVADYNPDAAWERIDGEANIARKDTTTFGQPYIWGTHHLDQAEAKWEAQLQHEAEIAWQLIYEGQGNVRDLCPAQILRIDKPEPDAPNGMVAIEVIHHGARDRAYSNTFKAIPSDRRFRLRIERDTWPKVAGTLTARVTSPSNSTYKYAYLNAAGRYVVRFEFDQEGWDSGAECVPLRMAKALAGKNQTGLHLPALPGDEAVIACRDGDPDKPEIVGFHHNSIHRDLITSEDRWLSRNRLTTQSRNLLELDDWEGEEYVTLRTEHSGKSQLTLGHINDGRWEKRGEGFELRTSGWGAIRGGKGLFISADDQPNASGQQLEMQKAQSLLQQALQISESLAATANAAQAIAADYARQKALLDDTLDQLKRAGMLFSAPAGMALVSGTDLQLTANENLIATAGGHADVSVLKRLTVAAGERISMLAQKLGVKIFAAKGKVEIQAQSDEMRLLADQNVTVTSANGRVVIEAKEELLLKCGGSYLRMSATGIEDGTRGERVIKSNGFGRQGPASMKDPEPLRNQLPPLPMFLDTKSSPASRAAILVGMPYQLFVDGTPVKQGVMDASGYIPVEHREGTQSYRVELANGVTYNIPVSDEFQGDPGNGLLANQGFHFHEEGAQGTGVDRAVHRQTYQRLLDNNEEQA
ncbi:type VI secretion system Vgr family protein [Ralstonia chuxiongensis]|uniref:type VI secretion system Vgr family protein n=1 Tax=Ralstonia chuxiongensis TaxID=2957504 RepID=UPI002646CCDD|nr:type VI secretion system Vgr family protein [Ralstonia chuxiongensis]